MFLEARLALEPRWRASHSPATASGATGVTRKVSTLARQKLVEGKIAALFLAHLFPESETFRVLKIGKEDLFFDNLSARNISCRIEFVSISQIHSAGNVKVSPTGHETAATHSFSTRPGESLLPAPDIKSTAG